MLPLAGLAASPHPRSYFAFGSNLNKSVFEGRRRITPADSLPAVLPGWKLTFAQPGLPYSEPCFAAVEPAEEAANSSGSGSGSSAPPDCHGGPCTGLGCVLVAHTYAGWLCC